MYGRDTSTVAFDKFAPSDSGITVETGTNEDLTARYNVLPRVLIITASEKGRRFPAVTYRPVGNSWWSRPAQTPVTEISADGFM